MLVLGTLATDAAEPPGTRAAEPPAVRAAEYLAAQAGRSASEFELVHEVRTEGHHLGGTDARAWAGKLVDTATGEIHTVHAMADGTMGGPELAAARIEQAMAALPALERKADPALLDALAAPPTPASPTLPVAIWLSADVDAAEAAVRERHPEIEWLHERPLADTAEAARTIRAELWEGRASVYEAAAAPVIERIVELGGRIGYASTSAPLLFADLPASAVEALAAEPGVVSLGLEAESRETMASAGPTVAADWTAGPGDQGNGVRVAVVEYHNVHNSGDLAGRVVATYSTTGTPAYASGAADHPTWVAGAVASGHGTYRGVAPGARIVSASTGGFHPSLATDRAVIAAADWAVSPGGGDADIVNTSFAQDTAQGAEEGRRYFDSIGWEDGRVVVSSAGNYRTFGHWNVLSPGTGWNVLTVGGLDHRGTPGTGDDRLWFVPGSDGSSYRDPAGTGWNPTGDFNKPNVSAPAVGVRTANGMIGSGTSIASPMVAGIVAQLMARDPTLLTWPEAARALVMAGAIRRTPMPSGAIDADHEGAGTVSALWSNRILSSGNQWGGYRVGTMRRGDRPTQQIGVVAGQRVRFVVAWSSHTAGSSNIGKVDTLTADLDLRVTGPDGRVVGSYTFDNSYEVVDIVAGATGAMTARVSHGRFDAGSEPYAIAWSIAPPFTDIETSPFFGDIVWAFGRGITAGCTTTRFCPTAAVTRGQMASFMVRALKLPATSRDYFTDDAGSIHQGDINRLAAAGITTGCAPSRYCPTAPVNREQMASFLVRALKLGPTTRDYFTDDARSIHHADINRLAAAGITTGCAGSRFCPTLAVTREQMVAFLRRALA